jgi:hypothetical protein
VNRQAQAVVLLLVGGAILRASLSDLYLRYVKEGLRPFLIAAGALLVASAIATLWYELRPKLAGHSDDDGHGHREPRVAWLLVLPVFALLLVAPQYRRRPTSRRCRPATRCRSPWSTTPPGRCSTRVAPSTVGASRSPASC